MKLILARHGNTFGPGDKVTWVGSSNDLPLVESGLAQAERAAEALASTNLAAIYCAPLLRTKKFAEIVAAKQPSKNIPIVENRLTELDYGDWSGHSDDEIAAKFGDSLSNWMNKSTWPTDCHWASSEAEISAELQSLVDELLTKYQDKTVLLVSSNGRLRYFLKLISGEFERRVTDKQFKMGTGRISVIEGSKNNFSVVCWNQEPAAIKDMLCAKTI